MAKNPMSPLEARIINLFGKYVGTAQARLYQATGGKWGAKFIRGTDVLLLTTTGRKSGEPRTVPLLYLQEGDRYYIVASKGGYPTHPAWYLNLCANPKVQLQVGAQVRPMLARTIDDEAKARVWPRLVAMYKDYADYQDRTDRPIPVVVLEPPDAAQA